jgi:hypothetical protein
MAEGSCQVSDKYDIDMVISELCALLVMQYGPQCPFCGKFGEGLNGRDEKTGKHNLSTHLAKEHIRGSAYDLKGR